MSASRDVTLLLVHLEQAYRKRSWHGPNLRGSIRGLTAEQAVRRPAENRRSIAEQVLHAAYWKYTIRRRLLGEKRGSFPLKGSNWFECGDLNEAGWRRIVGLLDEQHESLRAAIETLTDRDLARKLGTMTIRDLVMGIISHDVYHAGQINLIKRMLKD